MVAQLPHTHHTVDEADDTDDVAELRGVAGALLTRLAELRERDAPVPDALWRAAERFQPLLDGLDPEPGEAEELWELALDLPRLFAAAAQSSGAGSISAVSISAGSISAGSVSAVPVSDEAAALLVSDGVEHVEA